MNHPQLLIILDGFGVRQETAFNAIAAAKKPVWDRLLATYPNRVIDGSGECVGLPAEQMGNSEVGHLHMGAGRVVYQDLTRIDHAIKQGDFFENPALKTACQRAATLRRNLHIMGLLSEGGVHSHEAHLHALLQLAAREGVQSIYLHLFLDGRDVPPKSALQSIQRLEAQCHALKCGQIVSLIGRYYAMDRDKRFDRTFEAYRLVVMGEGAYRAKTAVDALQMAYARGEMDEFVKGTVIAAGETSHRIASGDIVIFTNFRSDRARALTAALTDPYFDGFARPVFPSLDEFVSFTEYDSRFNVTVAFPPVSLKNMLGAYLSTLGLKQLRIAETEKYAHVTFFFNGGLETAARGEDRLLIPSVKVSTYDLQPEMSAIQITDALIAAIKSQKYDLIVCNFANADMVGHTGNFDATVRAIETLDTCLGRIVEALATVNMEAIITADHGNAECMYDPRTNQPHTAHTSDPVPFLYIGHRAKLRAGTGSLADIAPTLLYLMHLPQPSEMTGESLLCS